MYYTSLQNIHINKYIVVLKENGLPNSIIDIRCRKLVDLLFESSEAIVETLDIVAMMRYDKIITVGLLELMIEFVNIMEVCNFVNAKLFSFF